LKLEARNQVDKDSPKSDTFFNQAHVSTMPHKLQKNKI